MIFTTKIQRNSIHEVIPAQAGIHGGLDDLTINGFRNKSGMTSFFLE